MLKGEGVCFYLREASKEGAERRFKGDPAEGMYQAANDVLHAIQCRFQGRNRSRHNLNGSLGEKIRQ